MVTFHKLGFGFISDYLIRTDPEVVPLLSGALCGVGRACVGAGCHIDSDVQINASMPQLGLFITKNIQHKYNNL